ncbi:MAG TPA: PTS sugar transporter subunit IIC [Gemmatimonadaceae bacterium]|nr:PTS sugar transporter subunit IIC [Gemmatimonadaceae bacterium]
MTLADLLPIALLGGVAGLDTVSFPQAMISRPLVAATLGGMLAGAPMHGLLVGAVLELIALETLPVGASRYPEWGSASVVAGAIYATGAKGGEVVGSLVVAVLGGLFVAWIGGWTMVKLRQRNAVWATRRRADLDAGSRGAVVGLQLSGLTADLARGVALSALAYAALAPAETRVLQRWTVPDQYSRALLVATAASVAVGAGWKLFHSTAGARWLFLGGLGIGLLVLGMR